MTQHQTTISSFVCPVVVGREQHLARVDSFLALQHPKGLLVSGDTGIGKSRLAAEAQAMAQRQGFQVFRGRSFETDRAAPYAPTLDLFASVFSAHDPAELLRHAGPLAAEMVKLLPDLAAPLAAEGLLPTPLPASDPEQERRRIFQALTQVLLRTASTRPVLVVLEDLHWSDESSLGFFLHLARRTDASPILLLMTYRSDEVHPALSSFLSSMDRERLAEELGLTPLSLEETEAMVRAVLHQQSPVRAEFLEAIHDLTEGNPFFLEEVLKSLVTSGQIYYAFGRWDWKAVTDLQVPRSVTHAVQRRLEQLTPAARDLAGLAAVAGRRFDPALLQRLTGQDEATLLGLIKELIASQLVVEESADWFAFRHALTREAIYAGLLTRERQSLHRSIGEAAATLYQDQPGNDSHLGDLAYHFYEAGAWDEALRYSRRAGERAQSLYAPRAAAEHFTRALEAAQRLSENAPPELSLARARAFQTLGDFERARADLETALENSRKLGQQQLEWEALIDRGLLEAGRDYHRAGGFLQRALDLSKEMGDSLLQARGLNRVGNWHLNVGGYPEALQHHEDALAIFRRMDDLDGTAETLDLLGMTSFLSGDLVKGADYYRQAIELFRRLDNRPGLASALGTLPLRGNTYNSNTMVPAENDLSSCVQDGELALETARQIGWRSGEVYAMFNLAFALGPQGEYSRALEYAWESLRGAAEIEHRQWMTAARCALGALYLDLLQWPEARSHLEEAHKLAGDAGSAYWSHVSADLLASTYIQSGDLQSAQSVLDDLLLGADGPSPGSRQSRCARAELALAQGQAQEALDMADGLIAAAPNSAEGRAIPRLSRLRGEALLALGRLDEAQTALHAARRAAAEQKAWPTLWRVHLSLSKLYRARGQRKFSREHLDECRTIIEKLAEGISDEGLRDAFLSQAAKLAPPAPTPSPRRAAREAFGGLTAREREVARLIAAGHTNRQIADALVVGERTVETHVSSILAKLSFTSRAQIASWAVEMGITDSPE